MCPIDMFAQAMGGVEGLDCLVPVLPQAAWRLLIDFLQFDYQFCNYVIPYFRPLGIVSLYLSNKCPAAGAQRTPSLKRGS